MVHEKKIAKLINANVEIRELLTVISCLNDRISGLALSRRQLFGQYNTVIEDQNTCQHFIALEESKRSLWAEKRHRPNLSD